MRCPTGLRKQRCCRNYFFGAVVQRLLRESMPAQPDPNKNLLTEQRFHYARNMYMSVTRVVLVVFSVFNYSLTWLLIVWV